VTAASTSGGNAQNILKLAQAKTNHQHYFTVIITLWYAVSPGEPLSVASTTT